MCPAIAVIVSGNKRTVFHAVALAVCCSPCSAVIDGAAQNCGSFVLLAIVCMSTTSQKPGYRKGWQACLGNVFVVFILRVVGSLWSPLLSASIPWFWLVSVNSTPFLYVHFVNWSKCRFSTVKYLHQWSCISDECFASFCNLVSNSHFLLRIKIVLCLPACTLFVDQVFPL